MAEAHIRLPGRDVKAMARSSDAISTCMAMAVIGASFACDIGKAGIVEIPDEQEASDTHGTTISNCRKGRGDAAYGWRPSDEPHFALPTVEDMRNQRNIRCVDVGARSPRPCPALRLSRRSRWRKKPI